MKKPIYLFVFISFLLSNTCMGDVIPGDSHYVEKCVKITNVDDYPEISFLGFVINFDVSSFTNIITSSECLSKGYRFNDFNIFAVSKVYLKGKDIQKIDFPKDPNAIASNIKIEPSSGYINDSIPISGIQQYFKIVGFTKTSLILYKWKEVNKFNNGKPDSTSTFAYEGDVSQLYQKIQVGIKSKQNPSSIDVFPNPAQKNFHLKMNNSYHGSVSIQVINLNGKVVKSQTIIKTEQILDTDIRIENLAVGTYTVSVKFGELVESKKIVIK